MSEETEEPFDTYCDGAQIAVTPYAVVLLLTRNRPSVETSQSQPPRLSVEPRQVGMVRVSLEHARVLAMLLKKNLRANEERTRGQIPVDPDTAHRLGISTEEDR